ncbi:putative transposase, partial [Pseudoloma neurophilia]
LIDTSTRPTKGYAEIVTDRTSTTLLEVIEREIRPGSIIYADEWAAYSSLRQSYQFEHRTIYHKYYFVDPNTSGHTQNVESYNNKIKKTLKDANGCLNSKKEEFFSTFVFNDTSKDNLLQKYLNFIAFENI